MINFTHKLIGFVSLVFAMYFSLIAQNEPPTFTCPYGQTQVDILVTTDTYSGSENLFTLTDGNTLALEVDIPYNNNSIYQYSYCFEEGTDITFTIIDTYGDGIFNGGYEILICDQSLTGFVPMTGNNSFPIEAFEMTESFVASGTCSCACPYDIYAEYFDNAECYADEACINLVTFGCSDILASNYNPFATSDDGSCEYIVGCMDEISPNYSYDAVIDDGSCIYILGCTNEFATNYNQDATTDDGSCIINGCTDIVAANYSDIATQDDSSCIYEGCTISSANNYNPNASINDNSCIILGCMLDVFPNYNPIATQSDGSCSLSAEEIIIGCTNLNTWTYDPNANFEDGSCLNDMTIGALGQEELFFI